MFLVRDFLDFLLLLEGLSHFSFLLLIELNQVILGLNELLLLGAKLLLGTAYFPDKAVDRIL